MQKFAGVQEFGASDMTKSGSQLPFGRVACWGYNDWGQLGNASAPPNVGNNTPVFVNGIPFLSPGPTGLVTYWATAIAAGGSHTCALIENGTVACWGLNDWGQLGNASAPPNVGNNNLVFVRAVGNPAKPLILTQP